jgi:hypothetical protein
VSIPLERRRSPRVTVRNHPGVPKDILDVSLGGFSIALPQNLSPGSVHDIGLRLGAGRDVALRVRVAYTRPIRIVGGRQLFVTGFAFLADVTNVPSRRTLQLAS